MSLAFLNVIYTTMLEQIAIGKKALRYYSRFFLLY